MTCNKNIEDNTFFCTTNNLLRDASFQKDFTVQKEEDYLFSYLNY